jgi:hypothetical protein
LEAVRARPGAQLNRTRSCEGHFGSDRIAAPIEVEQFVESFRRDPSVAVNLLVDRLLSSPHYGERWGRWWLDVARYAGDTNGQDENK